MDWLKEESIAVTLDALRRNLSCLGCGKQLSQAFSGTCSHVFCKGCFQGINLAMGRCMVCSAICVTTDDAEIPLIGGFAEAFARFDAFLQNIPAQTGASTRDDSTFTGSGSAKASGDQLSTTNNASVTAMQSYSPPEADGDHHALHHQQSHQQLLDQSIDLLAFTQHPPAAAKKTVDFAPVTVLRSTKKRRFLEESFDDSMMMAPTQFLPQPSPSVSLSASSRDLSTFGTASMITPQQQQQGSLSFALAASAPLTGDSSISATQSSQFGRMISDIDAIKKNIERMLDNATLANDETQFPMTETLHESLEDTMLSSPAVAPANGSHATVTTTPHGRFPSVLEETLVPDDDDDEDTSHVMSQELMPLSQAMVPPLAAAAATAGPLLQSTAAPTPTMSPQVNTSPDRIDMPHTIPLDFEPFSRTTSLATLPMTTATTAEPVAYFVTAVCNQPTHVDAFEAALAQGWIYDDLSRDDLRAHGFRCVNVLVCPVAAPSSSAMDTNIRQTQRTIAYMKALLLGHLIVDFRWLTDSIEAKRLLQPYSYELTGTVLDKSSRVPIRARFLPRGSRHHSEGIALLEEYSFTIVEEDERRLQRYTQGRWNVADIETLIVLCGARLHRDVVRNERPRSAVVASQRHLQLSLRLRPAISPMGSTLRSNASNGSCTAATASTLASSNSLVSVSWLFDTICNLRPPLDVSDYYLPPLT